MDIELVKQRLKSILRTKKINYKDLGAMIGMSESGVKKLFSAADLSMGRLSDICKAINIPLVDLIESAAKKEKHENYRLSKEQESFFQNNWDFFVFYWLICIEERTLDRIKQDYALTDQQTTKYLLKLDELDLIQYHSDEKIYHKVDKVLCFEDDSQFNNYMTNKFSVDHLRRCQNELSKENVYQGFHTIKLRKSTFEEFKVELAKLFQKYVDKMPIEDLLDEHDRKMLCFTFAMSHDSYVDKSYFN